MKRTCCMGLSTASTVEKAAVSAILILLNATPVSLGWQNPGRTRGCRRQAVAYLPMQLRTVVRPRSAVSTAQRSRCADRQQFVRSR